MLRCRLATDRAPRAKNGHPAHHTTGVDSASSTQGTHAPTARAGTIASTTRGRLSTAATRRRRRMSASSGLGPSWTPTETGSSAMPQIGHSPGPSCRISGCMGQVHSPSRGPVSACGGGALCPPCSWWAAGCPGWVCWCAAGAGGCPSGWRNMPHLGQRPGWSLVTSGCMGQVKESPSAVMGLSGGVGLFMVFFVR